MKKLENKEKDLKKKEAGLVIAKEQMFSEMASNLEKKSKEITDQESKLNAALNNISSEMKILNRKKEEITKMECSVLINELIGSIILSDYQAKFYEMKFDAKNDSFEENTVSEIYSSLNDFERIEEASNESSCEESYENYSSNYIERRDLILKDCEIISKENKEISDKLEALIASFNPKNELE